MQRLMDNPRTRYIRWSELYARPKSLLRELIQKLFLKLLIKLFPKKFLSYKNKIRFIMNKGGFYIYFYAVVTYLRFKYPLYYSLPSTQIYALHMTIKFLKILKPQKIDFFLLEGCLLGAVRQESFAGRPADIDFGIKEEELQKLLDAIPLLIKSGAKTIKTETDNKIERIHNLFPCILVDITVFRKKNVEKNEMWVGPIEEHYGHKFYRITFPVADLEPLIPIKAYEKKFLAPDNSEVYLEKIFGKSWRTPDKKQFFWNKNKFK